MFATTLLKTWQRGWKIFPANQVLGVFFVRHHKVQGTRNSSGKCWSQSCPDWKQWSLSSASTPGFASC